MKPSSLTPEELKAQLVLDTRTNPMTGKGYSYISKLSTEGNSAETNIMRFADDPGFTCSNEFKNVLNNDVLTIGLGPLRDGAWITAVKAIICNEVDSKNITTLDQGKAEIKELFAQIRRDCRAAFENKPIATSSDENTIRRQLTNIAVESVFKMAEDQFNKRTDISSDQRAAMKQLSALTQETLKTVNSANIGDKRKLSELAVLTQKAVQKARLDFIRGNDPAECAKNLAAEIRAIKNKTKGFIVTRALTSLFQWKNKNREFSDNLLKVLKSTYPEYKTTEKIRVKTLRNTYNDDKITPSPPPPRKTR